jgi:hypothetical protein
MRHLQHKTEIVLAMFMLGASVAGAWSLQRGGRFRTSARFAAGLAADVDLVREASFSAAPHDTSGDPEIATVVRLLPSPEFSGEVVVRPHPGFSVSLAHRPHSARPPPLAA